MAVDMSNRATLRRWCPLEGTLPDLARREGDLHLAHLTRLHAEAHTP